MKKLSKSEGNYVDSAVLTIIRAMIEKDQIQLNATNIKGATISAYDIALAMLSIRNETIEVEQEADWNIGYFASGLDKLEDEPEVKLDQSTPVEAKKDKPKKGKAKKDKDKKNKSKNKVAKAKKSRPENEYNIKPLLEAATEVVAE